MPPTDKIVITKVLEADTDVEAPTEAEDGAVIVEVEGRSLAISTPRIPAPTCSQGSMVDILLPLRSLLLRP